MAWLRRGDGLTGSARRERSGRRYVLSGCLADTLRGRLAPLTGDALQLQDLVHPGFVGELGVERLAQLERYLQGIGRRLDKAERAPHGDVARLRKVRALEHDFDRIAAQWRAGAHPVEAERVRWLLEELRVATFAQVLGTPEPVSENKVRAALEQLRRLG